MLSQYEQKLINNTIRRKELFLVLSIIGVILAITLAIRYTWLAFHQANFNVGLHSILVILILLNARQNLRQHNTAKVLEKLAANQISSTPQ